MRPRFRIEINGRETGEVFASRLSRLTINDREGSRSDTLEMSLLDGPPDWIEIPESRAVIRVWGGYDDAPGGLSYFGAFTDADVSIECLPYSLTISAKAADLRSGLKTTQERHWDGATLGEVISALAVENGLTPSIDPELGRIRFAGDWIAMQNESALAFGERLAKRYGGLFAVKDGRMILAQKGAGLSAGGHALAPLVIRPPMILTGSCSADFTVRQKVAEVAAEYQDLETGERGVATWDAARDGVGRFTLRYPSGSAEEAKAAARAKAREMQGSADRARVTVEGAPEARGGAPMIFEGVRPGLDRRVFVIESAAHRFSKTGGYTTAIEAKAKPGEPDASASEETDG